MRRICTLGQDQAKDWQDQERNPHVTAGITEKEGITRTPMAKSSPQVEISSRQIWSAVGSMALCVALLIASEFMPVSLLTPIARDLHATDGAAGQAISISGLFAVVASLLIATVASRFDRRHVLMVMTTLMLLSLVVIAIALNFMTLMIARALPGDCHRRLLVACHGYSYAPGSSEVRAQGARRGLHRECGSHRVRGAHWQLRGRHHRLARRLLGDDTHGDSESCLATG